MHKPIAVRETAVCVSLIFALFFLPAASAFAGVLALRTIGLTVSDLDRDDAAHAHLTLAVDGLREILAAPELQRFSSSALQLNDNVCSASIVDPDGHVLVLEEKTLPPSLSPCETIMHTEPR